jgi:hypothetical protein
MKEYRRRGQKKTKYLEKNLQWVAAVLLRGKPVDVWH